MHLLRSTPSCIALHQWSVGRSWSAPSLATFGPCRRLSATLDHFWLLFGASFFVVSGCLRQILDAVGSFDSLQLFFGCSLTSFRPLLAIFSYFWPVRADLGHLFVGPHKATEIAAVG